VDGDAIGPVAATPEEVHAFWFADALGDPERAMRRLDFWFRPTRQTDGTIRERFEPTLKAAGEGLFTPWEATAHTRVALVIVLDQFPRNIRRGTPEAFRHDARALAVARRGLAAGHADALTVPERAFLLMPFQHAEDVGVQRESVAHFERLVADAPPQWRRFAEGNAKYARLHFEIVERFGRFPHRNAILARASTPEEIEYLKSNGENFGQSGE
jgi:uncharacterized protein (DUF924 family)